MRRRRAVGAGRRARHAPPRDHRRRGQPSAGHERGRRVRAVFNGEIYNFAELRDRLERARSPASRPRRLRDDRPPLRGVRLEFARHLRGMFGIALWDDPRRRLVLARDRMGVKPMYWARTPAGLAFGSEVKSLIAGGLVEADARPARCGALPRPWIRARAADAVRGRAQAPAGDDAGVGGRPDHRTARVLDAVGRPRTGRPRVGEETRSTFSSCSARRFTSAWCPTCRSA